MALSCTLCVCASRDERFNNLQVPCKVHIDGPLLGDGIATARPELIAQSRLGPDALQLIAALLERVEKAATSTLLNNLGERADAASNHRRAMRECFGRD